MAGISLVFLTVLKRGQQNTVLLTESKQACHSRKLFLCTGDTALLRAGSHRLRQGPVVRREGRGAAGELRGTPGQQLPAAEQVLPWEADSSASAWLLDVLWDPGLLRSSPWFLLFFKEKIVYLAVQDLSCALWVLLPWPGIKPQAPCIGTKVPVFFNL